MCWIYWTLRYIRCYLCWCHLTSLNCFWTLFYFWLIIITFVFVIVFILTVWYLNVWLLWFIILHLNLNHILSYNRVLSISHSLSFGIKSIHFNLLLLNFLIFQICGYIISLISFHTLNNFTLTIIIFPLTFIPTILILFISFQWLILKALCLRTLTLRILNILISSPLLFFTWLWIKLSIISIRKSTWSKLSYPIDMKKFLLFINSEYHINIYQK